MLASLRTWLVLSVTILVLAFHIALSIPNPFPLSWGDTFAYVSPVKSLLNNHAFTYDNYGTGIAPPLYSLAILPAVALASDFNELTRLVGFLQSFYWALVIPILFQLGRSLGLSTGASLAAGLLVIATPTVSQFAQDIMSESIYIPLLTLAFLLATQPRSRNQLVSLLCVLILLGLTKPLALIPIAIFAGWQSVMRFRERLLLRGLAEGGLLFVLPCACLWLWLQVSPSLSTLPADLQGGYPPGYFRAMVHTLTTWDGFLIFAHRMTLSLGYTVLSAYLLPLVFVVSWRNPNSLIRKHPLSLLLAVLLWVAMAAITCVAQAVLFKNPASGHFFLYGRYVEPLTPVIITLSLAEYLRCVHATRPSQGPDRLIPHVMLLTFSAILLWFFPFSVWTGASSSGLTVYNHTRLALGDSWHLIVPIVALLTVPLFTAHRIKAALPIALVLALGLSTYGSLAEMQRVNYWKGRWKRIITAQPAYTKLPPALVEHLILESGMPHDKVIWYFGYAYLGARFYPYAQFEGKIPANSIVFSASETTPAGAKRCGRFGGTIYLHCYMG